METLSTAAIEYAKALAAYYFILANEGTGNEVRNAYNIVFLMRSDLNNLAKEFSESEEFSTLLMSGML